MPYPGTRWFTCNTWGVHNPPTAMAHLMALMGGAPPPGAAQPGAGQRPGGKTHRFEIKLDPTQVCLANSTAPSFCSPPTTHTPHTPPSFYTASFGHQQRFNSAGLSGNTTGVGDQLQRAAEAGRGRGAAQLAELLGQQLQVPGFVP